jgi:ubiquitin carboxyl-terminal hydrolase 8
MNDKGLTGLVNLGNTCFLNSCIQILNNTDELFNLLNIIYNEQKIKDIPESKVITEWIELRSLMWTNNGTVSPNKFVHNIHELATIKNIEIFTGWAQNDMTEFLLFIIDCMHMSISKSTEENNISVKNHKTDFLNFISKDYSIIKELFYGFYITEISSFDDKKNIHSVNKQIFFIIDLPIPIDLNGSEHPINIYDCFNLYTKDELLDGENSWFNEKTNSKEAILKKTKFLIFPKILVITFKRFINNNVGIHKNNVFIDFPIDELNLKDYIYIPPLPPPPSAPSTRKRKTTLSTNAAKLLPAEMEITSPPVYNLYGVCNHYGNVLGGHYTSFVKNTNNKWIHYNDTQVQIVDNPKLVVNQMAYCLFYKLKEN